MRGDVPSAILWIVRPGDGRTIADVLARTGAGPEAVAEGRVFLGRRRVRSPNEPVREGDEIAVAPVRLARPPVVIARTRDLVAIAKPAGVPTIADHAGSVGALAPAVAAMLGVEASRVHPTSRLDRDVSGVVVFALDAAAAARLAHARACGVYERRYAAIATRAPSPDRGVWRDPIGRARDPRLRRVGGREPVPAETRYATCARARGEGSPALLAVEPVTGRTHQIRVHAAHASAPLIGDRAYGGPARLTLDGGRVLEPGRVALHAGRVAVPDDAGGRLVAVAPIPDELRSLWRALGGDDEAWDLWVTCDVS